MSEVVVGDKSIVQKIQHGDGSALDDVLDIEAALIRIKACQDRIEEYKALKKKRAEAIDDALTKLNNEIGFLKEVTMATLDEHGKTKVDFPGVGRVNTRKAQRKWIVIDEGELLKKLKAGKELDNVSVQERKLVKKDLNKVLDAWDSSGSLPDCVEKEEGQPGVTVRFEEDMKIDESKIPDIDGDEDYDSLDFSK